MAQRSRVILLTLLSIAGFVHALITPRSKAFAPPEPIEAVKAPKTALKV